VNKKPQIALSDEERFPTLSNLAFLNELKQASTAPNFNFESGDRLTAQHLLQVQDYAKRIRTQAVFWEENTYPTWLENYLNWCIQEVPFYQDRSPQFEEQATIARKDICQYPWQFVANTALIKDLLVYQTSGTTGPAMDVLFNPIAQACWIPQLESILDRLDIHLSNELDKVAIAMICAQDATLTYASLSTYLQGSGVLKINLNEKDWNLANDRIAYLEHYNPEILTGDPFAFLALYKLQPRLRPKALVSSAMQLSDGLRHTLEAYFKCPVLDIYSMTECRMIAVAEVGKYKAIRPDLYLEIFDPVRDKLLPLGEKGELVVTGGNNPFLPLLRYRTGDFCRLQIEHGIPYLYDLQARKPVPFYTKQGRFINNIDISRALMNLPLVGFELHQKKNHELHLKAWTNEATEITLVKQLQLVFGTEIVIHCTLIPVDKEISFKPVQYSSAFEMSMQ